jgi:predicted hydrocarbon binding protein
LFRSKKSQEETPKEEVVTFDSERGALTRKTDGMRVVALGSHGWATIEKELESTFMTGGQVILQRVGYSYGRAMGREARRQEVPPEQTMETMQSLGRESGWGLLALNSGDLFSGEARITIKECFFCLHAHDATAPVCHTLVGLVNGIADEIIGVSHRVTETKCIAKGDAVCEVLIERLG